jgi:hypothetical protein
MSIISMMKKVYMKKTIVLLALIILTSLVFADVSAPSSTSTLIITGNVGPNNKLTVEQLVGLDPNDAIALDEGDAIATAEGSGVPVGVWRVKGNTPLNLYLVVTYSPFTTNIEGVQYEIPYLLYNYEEKTAISPEGVFATMQRVNGIYPDSVNTGTFSIKRTTDESFPAANTYITTITFALQTD